MCSALLLHDRDSKRRSLQHFVIIPPIANRRDTRWVERVDEIELLVSLFVLPNDDQLDGEPIEFFRCLAKRIGSYDVYAKALRQIAEHLRDAWEQVPVDRESSIEVEHQMLEPQLGETGNVDCDHRIPYRTSVGNPVSSIKITSVGVRVQRQ